MWRKSCDPPAIDFNDYWALGYYQSKLYPVKVSGVEEWQRGRFRKKETGESHWVVYGFTGNWMVLEWFDFEENN